MDHILIDTDVCSFLLKGDSRVQVYRPHLLDRVVCLSFQTVAELFQWAELHNWGISRRERFVAWLNHFLLLDSDLETCRAWARVRAERAREGQPISPQDAWIAACAIRNNMPLLTYNGSDYTNLSQLQIITGQAGDSAD
jgi:tRNA(fMet)-specific endonuclease VapC